MKVWYKKPYLGNQVSKDGDLTMAIKSSVVVLCVLFQSSVMSVCFARFHPNLVVGGTYSGQIVLWDNRSHRRTPVQRTPLSAAAHTVKVLFGHLLL